MYYEEVKIECEWNKRKKCDSAYIKLYNNLKKDYEKLQKQLFEYQTLVKIYRDILDEDIDFMERSVRK